MSIDQISEQMYYNDFNGKGAQIRKIDGNLEQLSKNDKKFWMQAQGKMGSTTRYHCHSKEGYQTPK